MILLQNFQTTSCQRLWNSFFDSDLRANYLAVSRHDSIVIPNILKLSFRNSINSDGHFVSRLASEPIMNSIQKYMADAN